MAGIYIHIPFCKQACHYCDFHFSTSLKNKEALLQGINKELEIQKDYLKLDNNETIDTIYLGGGTPSLLSLEELTSLFETIYKFYPVNPKAEVSLEANPDDLTRLKLKELSDTPVNRLSIGIQSFRDEDLKLMNRSHTAQEALKVVSDAQDVGFDNISIDLIYGTPTLSNENWSANLKTAFDLNVNHISAYCLTVEPKTALAHLIKEGKIKNVEDQKSADQFEIMLKEMKNNNFEQYEISNFCKEKNYSKHNSNYWLKKHYLGVGPSAHSYDGASRQWNVSNNNKYIQGIESYKGKGPWYERENLSLSQQYNEYILTTLRTIWGAELEHINSFGESFLAHLLKESQAYLQSGHIIKKNSTLFLSDAGKIIADKITSDLFVVD